MTLSFLPMADSKLQLAIAVPLLILAALLYLVNRQRNR